MKIMLKTHFKNFEKLLFILHLFEFIFLFCFSIFVYSLPRFIDNLIRFSESWDIFYKFLFQFMLNFLNERYIFFGNIVIIFAFLHLISALIVHGKFYKLKLINALASLFLFVFYPIGPFLLIWNLFLINLFGRESIE
ncbi:MAG: hypothetical protein KatS3mg085_534 [Candidatus Dojkabacteria bacterium]|nr:MAG: hypothetical protein KatS3mg085_534 [Candidatus Dojkabacteria bacterium]